MKRQKNPKEPEILRDTSHLTGGQKKLGITAICAIGLLLGAISGAVVWIILRIMSLGIDALWVWLPRFFGLGDSLLYHLAVCVIGGILIGLVRRRWGPLPDEMEQVLGRIKFKGSYPYDRLPLLAVAALLPLIFGASLGPEAGLTGIAAGLCCWVGDQLKCRGDQLAALTETGLAAALGVIFHAPLFGIAENLEPDPGDGSDHYRTRLVRKKTRIIIYCFGVVGAMLAFTLLGRLFGAGGGLPRFAFVHDIGLSQWKWFIPLLAIGIVFSLYYDLMNRITQKLGQRLMPFPMISCQIPAILMAVCGFFIPTVMFSGEHQLSELVTQWQSCAVPDLVLTAVFKLFLICVCINFGWRGGSIFPLIYSGACIGYAFALITGMDGAFAAAVVIASLYGYHMRKPVAVIAVLLLCFPVSYILPIGVAAFAVSKIPSPFASNRGEKPLKKSE